MGYLMPIVEEQSYNNLTHNCEDKRIIPFPRGISLKVNVIVQLDFNLAYYNVTVQHVSHDTPGTLPDVIKSYDIDERMTRQQK